MGVSKKSADQNVRNNITHLNQSVKIGLSPQWEYAAEVGDAFFLHFIIVTTTLICCNDRIIFRFCVVVVASLVVGTRMTEIFP